MVLDTVSLTVETTIGSQLSSAVGEGDCEQVGFGAITDQCGWSGWSHRTACRCGNFGTDQGGRAWASPLSPGYPHREAGRGIAQWPLIDKMDQPDKPTTSLWHACRTYREALERSTRGQADAEAQDARTIPLQPAPRGSVWIALKSKKSAFRPGPIMASVPVQRSARSSGSMEIMR